MPEGPNPFSPKFTQPVSIGQFDVVTKTGEPVRVKREPIEPAFTGGFLDRLRVDWIDPFFATGEKMVTDPIGAVGVAFDTYTPYLTKYGLYAVLFIILVVAILGLILPEK